jgi:hypothetical protein
MPRMPKSKKMKNMKRTAFARLGKDDNNEPISLRISGNALIDLNGLSTLRVRNDFMSPVEASG